MDRPTRLTHPINFGEDDIIAQIHGFGPTPAGDDWAARAAAERRQIWWDMFVADEDDLNVADRVFFGLDEAV